MSLIALLTAKVYETLGYPPHIFKVDESRLHEYAKSGLKTIGLDIDKLLV